MHFLLNKMFVYVLRQRWFEAVRSAGRKNFSLTRKASGAMIKHADKDYFKTLTRKPHFKSAAESGRFKLETPAVVKMNSYRLRVCAEAFKGKRRAGESPLQLTKRAGRFLLKLGGTVSLSLTPIWGKAFLLPALIIEGEGIIGKSQSEGQCKRI